MQPASASFPGGVSTSAQTFAGTKSFQTILAATDDTYDLGATASRFKNGYFSTSLSVGTYPLSVGHGYAALLDGGFPTLQLYAGASNLYSVFSDGNGIFLNNVGSGTQFAQFYDTHFALSDGTHLYLSGNSTGVSAFGTLSASNLSGTNTGDVTLGTANGLSLSAQVLSLGLSSTSTTGALSSSDWNTFNGKQGAGNYITALTGDGTASGPGSAALTLATVNSNVGSFGSSTAIPSFTVNGKGLITAASTNAVIAPAGTLTGTTLASNVVTSSLTTVGTIGTGVWQGTAIAATYGGTGIDTHASTGYPSISAGTWSVATAANTFITLWETVATTGGDLIYGGASGAPTRLANGSNGQFLKSNGGTSAPSWATPTISLTAPKITVYSSGSGNHSITGSPLYAKVTVVAGGGGGGGAETVSSGNSGGGGGSGSAAIAYINSPSGSYSYVVGGGGSAGSNSGSPTGGGSGSNSTFNSGAITANGGGGGNPAGSSSILGNGGIGGAIATGGTINLVGNAGASGSYGGATGSSSGGAGGGSLLGGGGQASTLSVTGTAGKNGGGGGGGANGAAPSAGGSGIIIVEEYYQ